MKRALIALLVVSGCRHEPAPPPIPAVVLTTPADNAVAQRLVALFERETKRRLSVLVVTPAQILTSNDAAAIFSDPGLEKNLTRARLRSVFAYSDFYILGPSNDPAHIRNAPTAQEALRRIARHHRRFCLPVEMQTPAIGSGVPCHGNAAEVIATASRLGAYTILDREAAESPMPKRFKVLLRDVPPLHTTYTVVLLPSTAPNHDAEWFVEWLMSDRGREAVEESIRNPRLYVPENH